MATEPESMVGLLRRGASTAPDGKLFQCGTEWQSYADIDTHSDVMASVLAELGVGRADRVAILSTNRLELVYVGLACGKLGAFQVPLHPYLKGEFLRHQLADSGAIVLLADTEGVATMEPVLGGTSVTKVLHLDYEASTCSVSHGIPVMSYAGLAATGGRTYPGVLPELGDTLSIMYTSGTTGLPRGCVISNGYALNSPRAWVNAGWLRRGDVVFSAFPLFHMGGQNLLAGALLADAPTVIEPRFSASSFIERAATERATLIRGVGAMAVAILAQPEKPDDASPHFRQGNFPPLAPAMRQTFEERFGISINNGVYGQTECIPAAIAPVGGTRRPDSCGQPAPGVELRLVDDKDEEVAAGQVGEIVVRPRAPHSMFSGYWKNPLATLEAWRGLWHHTGDFGRLDDDGFLYFVDRKKDAIRRRGENVSSMELEHAIRTHPAVASAAAIAEPSEMGEDDIKVFVVFDPGVESPSASEFFDFLKSNLPYFAIPRCVVQVTDLPVTQTGRLQKHLLRELNYPADVEWNFHKLGFGIESFERRGSAATTLQ